VGCAVWTCVGTLAILGRLDLVDSDTLCWWLCERQLPNGGLNGRPEKLEDVSQSPNLACQPPVPLILSREADAPPPSPPLVFP